MYKTTLAITLLTITTLSGCSSRVWCGPNGCDAIAKHGFAIPDAVVIADNNYYRVISSKCASAEVLENGDLQCYYSNGDKALIYMPYSEFFEELDRFYSSDFGKSMGTLLISTAQLGEVAKRESQYKKDLAEWKLNSINKADKPIHPIHDYIKDITKPSPLKDSQPSHSILIAE